MHLSNLLTKRLHLVDPKPGACPASGGGTCAEHCSKDSDCKDVQKCCSNGCGHDCFFPVTVKPGACPTLPPDTVGTCVNLCSVDSDCLGDQKCCSHGCGHSCSSPVSSCPPEPKCPIPPNGPPGTCKPQCIFEYKVINGLRCKVKCMIGPPGPQGPPCPPTRCPGGGIKLPPAAQQGFSGALLGGPIPTCAPVCDKPCPFGFMLDENNCPICECKTGCIGNAEPLFPSVNCAERPHCPSSYQCTISREGTFGVCCPIACPKAICHKPCEYGFKYDSAGCQTCDCRKRLCPARLCPWGCPKGYKLGKDSCQTCDCRRGITCPQEPRCPLPNPPHPSCPGPCIYQNRILDGITCRVNCFRGLPPPPGRPGDPCPPTGVCK
ncbi:Hypothetical predicted protein [Mytilus galloprovincialis]|uniref:Antistasin-like domain-containing protein n=1 Tax=Mytilus galloprovincialis TaxID=29158 RepID=A0A8B6EF25_MYTGA|nr:Hypothetical predicted protein [Mytilus galloprovincialis]